MSSSGSMVDSLMVEKCNSVLSNTDRMILAEIKSTVLLSGERSSLNNKRHSDFM